MISTIIAIAWLAFLSCLVVLGVRLTVGLRGLPSKSDYIPRSDRAVIPQDVDALTKRLTALSREIEDPALRDAIYGTVSDVRNYFKRRFQSPEAAAFTADLQLTVDAVTRYQNVTRQSKSEVLAKLYDEAMALVVACGVQAGDLLQQRQNAAITAGNDGGTTTVAVKSVSVVPGGIRVLTLKIERLQRMLDDGGLRSEITAIISLVEYYFQQGMPHSIVDNFVDHLRHVERLLATHEIIKSRPSSVGSDYDDVVLLVEVREAVAAFKTFTVDSVRYYLDDVARGLRDHSDHLRTLELPKSERYRAP